LILYPEQEVIDLIQEQIMDFLLLGV